MLTDAVKKVEFLVQLEPPAFRVLARGGDNAGKTKLPIITMANLHLNFNLPGKMERPTAYL